jgi:hypothetical protein
LWQYTAAFGAATDENACVGERPGGLHQGASPIYKAAVDAGCTANVPYPIIAYRWNNVPIGTENYSENDSENDSLALV